MRRTTLLLTLCLLTVAGCGQSGGGDASTSGAGTAALPVVQQAAQAQTELASTGADAPQALLDDQNTLHVIWQQGEHVVYRSLAPNGTLSPVANLTETYVYVNDGHILRDPAGQICVTWHGAAPKQLGVGSLFIRCRRGNEMWNTPREIQEINTYGHIPAFAPDGSVVFGANFAAAGTVGFVHERDERVLLDPDLASGIAFAIDAAGTYHAVWLHQKDPDYGLRYRSSKDGGKTWGEPTRADDAKKSGGDALLAADALGNVHLTFFNGEPQYRLWTQKSGWGPVVGLEQNTEMRIPGALAVDGKGRGHVVSTSIYGLFYTRQAEGGAWSVPVKIEAAGEDAGATALAVGKDGRAYIVWAKKGAIVCYGPLM